MIEVKNLCYTYATKTQNPVNAVKDVNFTLKNSEIMGIIGKTGSGKSTLAQLLCGLLTPNTGHILLDGKDIGQNLKNIEDIYFKITMALQYPENQLFGKTVYDDIAFGPRNKGICESEIKNIVYEAIKFTNLSESLLNRSPLYLSGGEKRKCAIAGVMALKPEILILDEPTAGLDYESKIQLLDSITEYHKKEKNILILISHSMEETAKLCDKILVLDRGNQVIFDSPQNVFKEHKKLKNLDLDIPQTAQIMRYINEKYPVNTNILSSHEAEKEIIKILNNRGA